MHVHHAQLPARPLAVPRSGASCPAFDVLACFVLQSEHPSRLSDTDMRHPGLYRVGRDHVVAFDFPTTRFLGVMSYVRQVRAVVAAEGDDRLHRDGRDDHVTPGKHRWRSMAR